MFCFFVCCCWWFCVLCFVLFVLFSFFWFVCWFLLLFLFACLFLFFKHGIPYDVILPIRQLQDDSSNIWPGEHSIGLQSEINLFHFNLKSFPIKTINENDVVERGFLSAGKQPFFFFFFFFFSNCFNIDQSVMSKREIGPAPRQYLWHDYGGFNYENLVKQQHKNYTLTVKIKLRNSAFERSKLKQTKLKSDGRSFSPILTPTWPM